MLMSLLAGVYNWVMALGIGGPVTVVGGIIGLALGKLLSSECHRLCDGAHLLMPSQCVLNGWVDKQGVSSCPEPILYGFLFILPGLALLVIRLVRKRWEQR